MPRRQEPTKGGSHSLPRSPFMQRRNRSINVSINQNLFLLSKSHTLCTVLLCEEKKRRKISCFHRCRRNFQRRCTQRERDKEGVLPHLLFAWISHHKRRYTINGNGASKHMSRYKGTISVLKEKQFTCMVELGDNYTYSIQGVGYTYFHLISGDTLHVEYIIYIPGLNKNLLSVTILEDKVFRVIFMENQAYLWSKN